MNPEKSLFIDPVAKWEEIAWDEALDES